MDIQIEKRPNLNIKRRRNNLLPKMTEQENEKKAEEKAEKRSEEKVDQSEKIEKELEKEATNLSEDKTKAELMKKIIDKTPSPGLWPGQTDEGVLGVSYEDLDKILPLAEKGLSVEEIGKEINIDREKISRAIERMKKTEFKRK